LVRAGNGAKVAGGHMNRWCFGLPILTFSMKLSASTILGVVLLIACATASFSIDADGLMQICRQIHDPQIDPATTSDVRNLVIEENDVLLSLDSGRIAFFEPVIIDSAELYYGGFFEGIGSFEFFPSNDEAQVRLERYEDNDSLDYSLRRALLLFSRPIYQFIQERVSPAHAPFGKGDMLNADSSWMRLTNEENEYFVFQIMRHMMEPSDDPFLMINPQKHGWQRSHYYCYDPLFVENIRFMKSRVLGPEFAQYIRTLSAYSCELGKHREGCKKLIDPQVSAVSYDIDARIENSGELTGDVTALYRVNRYPAQLLWFMLYEDMKIDSIVVDNRQKTPFLRYTKSENKSADLYLVLDRARHPDDTLKLHFYYHGPAVIVNSDGKYSNVAGLSWYPTYLEPSEATYSMKYTLPNVKDLRFESVGENTGREVNDSAIVTTWEVTEPAYGVYFQIE
jgi:hypothetical protein